MTTTPPRRPARLPWAVLAGVVVGWLVVSWLVGVYMGVLRATPGLPDVRTVRADLVAPHLAGLIAVVVATALWGRWRDVWREPRDVHPLWWAVPVAVLVGAVVTTDVDALRTAPPGLVSALAVGCALAALDTELVLRGVCLVALRDRWPEPAAAVGTVLLSGAVEVLTGPGTPATRAVVGVATGVVLYVARRVGGGLAVPVLLHAAVDLALWSHAVGDAAGAQPGTRVQVLGLAVLAVAAVAGARLGGMLRPPAGLRRRRT
ncbi:CPBP family glutamic-type intramembrane protease [Cellulomonas shaoxiangyii]|uniref:CPBP family intramembrane metalloprotease n=1 Tax=Cellulomonas shaoxiangyii TaxID=2566013 RepID=A0A4P7SGQ0_9CELL|nr:CPBP family glutamic-type intramembrane protease [Cellulomonas shaoxiangyii]QCB93339.1 CPBP family intramembrane metalloprotease [Cellulomonas shaoxiangyii]TGY85301.1 CPBP family intramembrane metalloprotease [Cellulomonas shaoxiangyii]